MLAHGCAGPERSVLVMVASMFALDATFAAQGSAYAARIAASRARASAEPDLQLVRDARLELGPAQAIVIRLAIAEVQLADRTALLLRSAGRRAAEQGDVTLGETLERIAEETWTFQEEVLEGVTQLIADWNHRWGRRVDLVASLSAVPSASLDEVVSLYEIASSGPAPWTLLAIALEIEALAVLMPSALVEGLREQLDGQLGAGMKWLDGREARCACLATAVRDHLARNPEREPELAEAGVAAIATFTKLLAECGRSTPALEAMGLAPRAAGPSER